MHHPLITGSRVLAGIVGVVAFYFAFFLYEDEEGIWQNRIENLWISVYDRARVTNSTTTALFNKLAKVLQRTFSLVFGERLLSIQAISVSSALSIGTGVLCAVVLYRAEEQMVYSDLTSASEPGVLYQILEHLLSRHVVGPLYSFAYEYLIPGRSLSTELSCILICFGLAILPTLFKRKWAVRLSTVPLAFFLLRALTLSLERGVDMREDTRPFFLLVPVILLLSVLWDFAAISVIRKLLVSVSEVVTLIRSVSVGLRADNDYEILRSHGLFHKMLFVGSGL